MTMSNEWTPPCSPEAEEAVIAACLAAPYDANLPLLLADVVSPSDFYYPRNRRVFSAMLALASRGEPVDVLFIEAHLATRGIDELGQDMHGWLVRLSNDGPTQSRAKKYAEMVAEKALLRQLLMIGSKIREAAVSGVTAREALDEAESMFIDIATRQRSSGSLRSMKEIMTAQIEVLEERYLADKQLVGVPTGFLDLDEKLSGLRPGAMYIIGARPAMGKTSLSMCIGANVAATGAPVLAFSLEMGHAELADRMLATEGLVSGDVIRSGNFSDTDWNRVGYTAGKLADLPFDIDDDPRVTINQIRSRARRVKARRGALGLIIVDYLQLMKAANRGESRQREVAESSEELKRLARELDVPVIALAQLNRKLEERNDKRPMLSDLKESGSLEQDSDVVMFVYRDEVYDDRSPDKGVAEINIAKQRNGPTGVVRLAFRGQYTRFDNMARTSPSPALASAGYDGGTRYDDPEF